MPFVPLTDLIESIRMEHFTAQKIGLPNIVRTRVEWNAENVVVSFHEHGLLNGQSKSAVGCRLRNLKSGGMRDSYLTKAKSQAKSSRLKQVAFSMPNASSKKCGKHCHQNVE